MLSIRSVKDLMVGDVGFYVIAGRVGGVVALGQALLRDECWFTHAYIVVQAEDDRAVIIEAMPGGARTVRLEGVERCVPGYGWARLPLNDAQRPKIRQGLEYLGVRYSFLDYLSLALLHLGLPRRFVAKRVTDSGHMICSQLVDTVLCRAGFHLFDDGRLSQDVTPGALFRKAGAIGEVTWY